VIMKTAPPIDDRSTDAILREFWQRRYGYVPEWSPARGTAGQAIAYIFARYVSAILQRLNQAPDKNKLAFLDLVGVRLVPASQARAPIVFQLTPQASDSSAPAGTRVAAPPAPGSSQPLMFETERATGIAAASLVEVVSLWPGRDQYIDHSVDYLAGRPITVFQSTRLQPTPHLLYLGHSTVLAFSGTSRLEVEFELEQGSSSPLDILWQYWDGSVWRGFKSVKATCLAPPEQGFDGTRGLMFTGSVRLVTDCAQTAPTTVNDVESYWLRGQLTQPLPPDPAVLLPIVDSIRLRTTIEQELAVSLQASVQKGTASQILLTSEGGHPLAKVPVVVKNPDDSIFKSGPTSDDGTLLMSAPVPGTTYEVQVSCFNDVFSTSLKYDHPFNPTQFHLILKSNGLKLDAALVDGQKVDISKPFFPFGQQPQPGATFYFSQEEVFSKSGASVRIFAPRTQTPQDLFKIKDSQNPTPLEHVVSWEYWNGFDWVPLAITSEADSPNPGDLNTVDVMDFDVPSDLAVTEVNNRPGLWMRIRVVSGGFGFTKEVKFKDGAGQDNTFVYVITVPPALSDLRMSYVWQTPFTALEQVVTSNDFQYEDHTEDARWPGNSFSPYKPIPEISPALYFGLTEPLPVNDMGVYFDILEQTGSADGPSLVWEYFNGGGWRELTVDDETRRLRLPGIVSFIAPDDSVAIARFDRPLHWVRARLKEDGPPGEATLNQIYLNAVWASQRQTYNDTPLGVSTGLPDQVFVLTQVPVLAGERIEVRELSGGRANVEWRTLALELGKGEPTLLTRLEAKLGAEGSETELVEGDLRLVRDRSKRVIEAWVRWQGQPHLFFSGDKDRHYVLDGALGRIGFGNGTQGRIPPSGAAITARRFQSGGGLVGNVAARTIKQLLGSVGGVQALFNPRAAEGGADGETLKAYAYRAPDSIRHRGRAITPADYETMAYEASAGVARARAIPDRDASGQRRPGCVTVVIIPSSSDLRPVPSFGLREEVQRYLETRAPAGIAESHSIDVTGPTYQPIDVDATLAPKDPSQAGAVEEESRAALADFLNPLRGGPDGEGWDLGRGVFLSDVAGALARVRGIDYVADLGLSVDGVLAGNEVPVAPDRMVASGQIRLKLI
jgi:Baseplate J-like protein